mgnify:CR=1 FL=1|tara:strand:+ start:103 stop:960 length:858 start_codon:yes stop_codon:yes gene_type:complete
MANEFCVFILSHGRPENVKTLTTLKKQGYTGDVYIIIDDEDESGTRYKELYGDKVLIFCKDDAADITDAGDNFKQRNSVIYARNASFQLARDVGYKYFIQLDDDYDSFWYKFDEKKEYGNWKVESLDALFSVMVDYLSTIPFASIAMSQGGDHIGGGASKGIVNNLKIGSARKAMNSFVCSTDNPFRFIGRMNDDVNTYVCLQRQGTLFLTINSAELRQATTQASAGGLTDMYLQYGTYVKSFYTVMYAPSCAKISTKNRLNRIHHSIKFRNIAPLILRESVRKQ